MLEYIVDSIFVVGPHPSFPAFPIWLAFYNFQRSFKIRILNMYMYYNTEIDLHEAEEGGHYGSGPWNKSYFHTYCNLLWQITLY